MNTRLKKKYDSVIKKDLASKFKYLNVMQIPRLDKVVINMSVKEAASDSKIMEKVASELFLIAGQKPVITKAKKSIAGFKLRKDSLLGCCVTLRGGMMYEFMDRLVSIALPRVKDFRGISPRQFDKRGNLSFGLREHIVFPEINYDKVDKIRGMDITIVTTANTDEESRVLLELFDVPFSS